MPVRYLTKSRFKLGLECPTKLYYTDKPEYANQNVDDPFLTALADGGFQVGELAKCYFPGGQHISATDYAEALAQTSELLKREKVIIFEGAVCFENLMVRCDILIKNQNRIELIEVKAKCCEFDSEDAFLKKDGTVSSSWQPYLSDVAFQKYVIENAFPDYTISAYLMMANKNALCPTDGLNQKFRITKDQAGRRKVSVSPDLSQDDLAEQILVRVQVDSCCAQVYAEEYDSGARKAMSFADFVNFLADHYARDEKIPSPPSGQCKNCEFKASDKELAQGLKSGFHECWQESMHWKQTDFEAATMFEISNFRKKDDCLKAGRIKLCDINISDINPKKDGKPGISLSERQWLQVEKEQNKDTTHWIDYENLAREMRSWVYPLHFIDFETAAAAIPFNKGRHPYEGIAFQFSHHVVHEDGRVEHRGQYLNTVPGYFPNYDFVRNLHKELSEDQGSIFRYATHENTYLNKIYQQLKEDQNHIPDRDDLCGFIRSITKSVSGGPEKWEGPRSMIDMCELVKRYYYDPATKGSNSIKQVLPAILNGSEFLQRKYSKPIYGADKGIPSLNYQYWTWIKFADGRVVDPYKLLPKMFQDVSDEDNELLSEGEELRDGGAALTAYARMQFEEMSEYERSEISKALLKYCELDTLAMVMIYEGWQDLINQARK